MTDDIVTRLRDLAMKEDSPWANIYDHVMRQAADEIEELRKDLSLQARCIGRHYEQFADLHSDIERLRAELKDADWAIRIYKKMLGVKPTITKFGDE